MKLPCALVVLTAWAMAMVPTNSKVVEVSLESKKALVSLGSDTPPIEMTTYNGQLPGPTIEAEVGDTVKVHYTNSLDHPQTLHFHGVELPATMDGSAISQPPVAPGDTFLYEFKVNHAATHWYHPHRHGHEHIERGLYGALVIRDSRIEAQLPSSEHVLMLDDILLDQESFQPFIGSEDITPVSRAFHLLNGRYGGELLVNKAYAPVAKSAESEVPLRLKLINVANARFMRVSIPGQQVWRIGGDGGLFEHPVEITPIDTLTDDEGNEYSNPDPSLGLLLTPGERAELVFRPTGEGPVLMEWHDMPIGFHEVADTLSANHANPIDGKRPKKTLLQLNLTPTAAGPVASYTPPSNLVVIKPIVPEDTEPIEYFFGHGGADTEGWVSLYGQRNGTTNLAFEDVTPELAATVMAGDERYLDVANVDGMDHNVHLHGFFFQHVSTTYILKDGNVSSTVKPSVLEWQDTIWMPRRPEAGGKTVQRLAVRFGDDGEDREVRAFGKVPTTDPPKSGGWLIHCHIVSHGDYGMQSFIQVKGHTDSHEFDEYDEGEMVSCGDIKSKYGKVCCGLPNKVLTPEGLTCSSLKAHYKVNACCGAPEKMMEFHLV